MRRFQSSSSSSFIDARRATSARTAGATSVPKSSIERSACVVRQRADAHLREEALVAEDLVLEEDLLDHLVGAADDERAARVRRASKSCRVMPDQPRSRPIRFIIAAYAGKNSSARLLRTSRPRSRAS